MIRRAEPVPVKRIPIGVRALPVAEKPAVSPKIMAESCGSGHRVGRLPRLDEIDGDTFK